MIADSLTVPRNPSWKMFADLTFSESKAKIESAHSASWSLCTRYTQPYGHLASFWGAGCSKNLCWEFLIRWRSSLSCSRKVAYQRCATEFVVLSFLLKTWLIFIIYDGKKLMMKKIISCTRNLANYDEPLFCQKLKQMLAWANMPVHCWNARLWPACMFP